MRVENDVLNVLAASECNGNRLRLTTQMDRKMYLRVNNVLQAAGGKWSRKDNRHIFDGPAADAIDAVILTGEIVRPQDFGAFFTPPELAKRVVELARIEEGMEALEPSAGQGALADLMRVAGAHVLCVELLPKNCEVLLAKKHRLIPTTDFIGMDRPVLPARFDRIVMNPPFAKRNDILHIMHALSFLKPTGRLVAIASASVMFREDQMARNFRELVEMHSGTIDALPEGSFKSSGTMVNTALVIMNGEDYRP